MTIYILGAATLILLILIVWRRVSPEFRRRSEQPKYQVLSNLGLDSHPDDDSQPSDQPSQPSVQKGTNEKPQP
jgi:hypothetical protein